MGHFENYPINIDLITNCATWEAIADSPLTLGNVCRTRDLWILEQFIDRKFHTWHILVTCQVVKGIKKTTVSKKQPTVHQETKKSVWAKYQNLQVKDEHEELKTWYLQRKTWSRVRFCCLL